MKICRIAHFHEKVIFRAFGRYNTKLSLQPTTTREEYTCENCDKKCSNFNAVGSRDSLKVDNWKFCDFVCVYKYKPIINQNTWKEFVNAYGSNGAQLDKDDEDEFLQMFSQKQ
jgi:hypothetical protein